MKADARSNSLAVNLVYFLRPHTITEICVGISDRLTPPGKGLIKGICIFFSCMRAVPLLLYGLSLPHLVGVSLRWWSEFSRHCPIAQPR
jgi:hypothetical protein